MSFLKTWLPRIVWADILLTVAVIGLLPQYPKWLPGFTPMFSFRKKYPVDVSPNVAMMVTTWVMMLGSLAASYVVFSRSSPKVMKLFPMTFHVSAFPAVAISIAPWIFIYGHEKFLASAAILLVASILFITALAASAKKRASTNIEPGSNELWWYDRTTLDGIAICSVWYTNTVVTFGSRSLGYKDGPSEFAQLSGWCNPNAECTAYLLSLYVIYVLAWIFLDLYYCPHITKNIKAMYPMICYTSTAVFIQSYPFSNGIPFNHLIHMVIMVVALFVGILRHALQKNTFRDKKAM